MPPTSSNKVTKSKASARKPKATVPLEKYEMDLFIIWGCYSDLKADKKIDLDTIGNTVGLNKKATAKRLSRISIAMRDWKEKHEQKETEGNGEQPEANEEVEAEETQVEEEDTQEEAEEAQVEEEDTQEEAEEAQVEEDTQEEDE